MDRPEFKLCHLGALRLRESHLNYLGFSFLIHEMDIIITLASENCY